MPRSGHYCYMSKASATVLKVLKAHEGEVLKLDLAPYKEQGFIGMQEDFKHDPTVTPFPIKDEVFTLLSAAHMVHTIGRGKPFIEWMNECWRVLKYDGQLRISTPYAGNTSFWSDPRSVNGLTPQSFFYFDPLHPTGMYKTFKPQPWKIEQTFFQVEGMIEVLLSKRRVDSSYKK